MTKVENITNFPSWALSYVVNDDASYLNDEEQKQIDDYIRDLKSSLSAKWLTIVPEGTESSFSYFPAFGGGCEVESVNVIYVPKN